MNQFFDILNQINNKRLFKSLDLSLNIIISIKFQNYQLYNTFFLNINFIIKYIAFEEEERNFIIIWNKKAFNYGIIIRKLYYIILIISFKYYKFYKKIFMSNYINNV